jgi:hypothetical protein
MMELYLVPIMVRGLKKLVKDWARQKPPNALRYRQNAFQNPFTQILTLTRLKYQFASEVKLRSRLMLVFFE